MGYKITNVREDIRQDIEEYLRQLPMNYCGDEQVEKVLNIIDKRFKRYFGKRRFKEIKKS